MRIEHVSLVHIAGTILLVLYLQVKSLKLIPTSGAVISFSIEISPNPVHN